MTVLRIAAAVIAPLMWNRREIFFFAKKHLHDKYQLSQADLRDALCHLKYH